VTISSENLFLLLDLQFFFHQLPETTHGAPTSTTITSTTTPCQDAPKLANKPHFGTDIIYTLVHLPHRTKVYASNKTFYSLLFDLSNQHFSLFIIVASVPFLLLCSNQLDLFYFDFLMCSTAAVA